MSLSFHNKPVTYLIQSYTTLGASVWKERRQQENEPSYPNGLHHLSPSFWDSTKIHPLMNNLTHRHNGGLEGRETVADYSKKTQGEIRIILGGMMKKQGKEKDVG